MLVIAMRVRLGYVSISMAISATTSSPYTYSEYLKSGDLKKLDDVITSNLLNLEKIVNYNIKNNIHFYRISSKIIPLATKDDVTFDYISKYSRYYERIGKKIEDNKMRVDFHLDQYTVLNSTNSTVLTNSMKILEYHYNLLNALNIKDKLLVIHVGSGVFGKENSIKRFINNFKKLPSYIQEIISIENDDKLFNVEDCLKMSKILDIPLVLDYHHYNCNKSYLDIKSVFDSWNGRVPKVHFSSPKNSKDFRKSRQ